MGSGETSDFPNLVVEWLPGQGANATNGTWVDITDYVTGFSTKRGRQYELDQFQAGTCELSLIATSRLFDPENTAGTYYGQLLPMKQIRLVSRWSGTTYSVFRGYITDWGQTIVQDKLFQTTVKAADAFVRLEQIKMPSSAWALEVLQDNPTAWFRLGETDTVRVTDSTNDGNYGLYDNCDQGVEGLVVNDADGAAAFSHSTEERIYIQNNSLLTGPPFTISCMIRINRDDPTGQKMIFSGVTSNAYGTLLFIAGAAAGTAAGLVRFQMYSAGDNDYTQSIVSVDDDRPHHVAVVVPSTTVSGWKVYIDGVDQTATVAGTATWPGQPTNGWVIGNFTDLLFGDYGFGTDVGDGSLNTEGVAGAPGTIDEMCIWSSTALTSGQVAAHALAAVDGWDGDDSGARVTRFLDAISWPASLRDISTGASILGSAKWSAGESALSVMQGWADTEFGMFYVDADGRIVWRSRHFPYLDASAVTSQATFGDGHSTGILVDEIEFTRDEALIRNPVQASRDGGVTVVASDTTYVATYGDRTWAAPTTQDQLDATVRDRAVWLLGRYKELGTRLVGMELFPRRSPAVLWPQALGREIGDRITIKRTPLGLNAEIVKDFIIEGVEHEGSPMQWRTVFRGSPVDPGVNTYLILDDATYGKLNTAKLGY